jgi:hypothetical protein
MSGQLIPQSEVDRANEDIVAVISGYLPDLKKAGKNYVALCPFHKEKTPSFGVVESKDFYYCQGCGAGGDAVGFVMAMNPSMSFRDAVKSILGEITLESSAARREPVIRATRCDLPGSAENRERAAEIMSRTTLIEKHTYLMRNNTAPGHPVPVNGKGILIVPLINNIGETVNVAAILTSGAINYAADKPSFGATAILDPLGEHDGKIILCVDYAHAWRIWWAQLGNSRVLAALDADNFRWMLSNCSARFTHIGCDPGEADEHVDMGRGVVALPLDPYTRIDRNQSAA